MIIEFVGLPGVGKTTISKLVNKKLIEKGCQAEYVPAGQLWKINNNNELIKLILVSWLIYPKRSFKLYNVFIDFYKEVTLDRKHSIKQYLNRGSFMKTLTWNKYLINYNKMRNRAYKNKIFILDRGLLQSILGIKLKHELGKKQLLYLRSFYNENCSDVTVFMKASCEIINKHRKIRNASEVKVEVEQMILFEKFCEIIADKNLNKAKLVVQNNQPKSQVAYQVINHVVMQKDKH